MSRRKGEPIRVGQATLPAHDEGGWAIPGGHVIASKIKAVEYAVVMDRIMAAGVPGLYRGRKAA